MIGIQYLCEIFGISYADLARRLGISRQTIAAWTSGRRKVSEKHYEKLKKIFKVNESWFNKQLTELDKLQIQKIKIENDKLQLMKERKKTIFNHKIKNIDKTTIILDQGVSKANGEEFTNDELEEFLNDYIEWIESKGLITGGGCDYWREEE